MTATEIEDGIGGVVGPFEAQPNGNILFNGEIRIGTWLPGDSIHPDFCLAEYIARALNIQHQFHPDIFTKPPFVREGVLDLGKVHSDNQEGWLTDDE